MKVGDYMYELYHYGIKGMKWGVRKDRKVNKTVTDKNGKKYKYTTINIKHPKRGGFKEKDKIFNDYITGKISKKQLEDRTDRVAIISGREMNKLRKQIDEIPQKTINKGVKYINNIINSDVANMTIQQFNSFAMQETTRASINAALQTASLSTSAGMDPFMFGMM